MVASTAPGDAGREQAEVPVKPREIQTYEVLKTRFNEQAAVDEQRAYDRIYGDLLDKTILATEKIVRMDMKEDAVLFAATKTPKDVERQGLAFEAIKKSLEAAGWVVRDVDTGKFWVRRK